jgi:SAM-dependent methyltransferase
MLTTDFEADSYFGRCSICGQRQDFIRETRPIRETYRCKTCKASLREREQAQAILGCYGDLHGNTLQELVTMEPFKRLNIYEPGTVGPFRKIFKPLPNYHQSDYYPEADRSKATPELPHQSLEALTYSDEHFDLIISSDIIEHIRRPLQAFAETRRVLKPGGYHVFTVPLQEPIPDKTVTRVDVSGEEEVHLLPECYHGNGKGGRSLVYNDFGRDIVEMLTAVGFSAFLRRANTASTEANRAYTVIARRY